MPDSGPEEIVLEITDDGTAATWWWTEEADQILSAWGRRPQGLRGSIKIHGVVNRKVGKANGLCKRGN